MIKNTFNKISFSTLIAVIILVLYMSKGCRNNDYSPPREISTHGNELRRQNRTAVVRSFEDWDSAGKYLRQQGIRSIHLEDIKHSFKAAYRGKWSEEEKIEVEKVFGQKEIWEENTNTEIISQLGACGIRVTNLSTRSSDAIVTGTLNAMIISKKIVFLWNGSLTARLRLEIRTNSNDELIAIITIDEDEDIF